MTASVAEITVKKWVLDGITYTPLVWRGIALTPEAVAELATAPQPAPVRRLVLQLGDEGAPRSGQAPPLNLRRVQLGGTRLPPVTFADLEVGRLEQLWIRPAGAVPQTTGRVMGGIARLDATRLGDVVWRGVQATVLTGVSIRCFHGPGMIALIGVRLGDRAESCLAAAHVVRGWEEPTP
jgi:hypothetical protein